MPLFAMSLSDIPPGAQLLLAALLGALGSYLMLPRPRGQMTWLGLFLLLAGFAIAGTFLYAQYGQPSQDQVGAVLFWVFSAGALLAGIALVTQRNPARGAMAFAVVILCSSGLFLLLAAPFLMAASVVVYAGAIIVTFLFVLMLSHANGPSDENDRSRDPLLGSLGGFAFFGLILFSLYLSSPAAPANVAPAVAPPITADDYKTLQSVAQELKKLQEVKDLKALNEPIKLIREKLGQVVGYAPGETLPATLDPKASSVQDRLAKSATDARVWAIIAQAQQLRDQKKITLEKAENLILEKGNLETIKPEFAKLRDQTILLSGRGLLPARNVTALGMSLYSEHLIAVEMAGTLLLIATIGAVAIAQRKGTAQ